MMPLLLHVSFLLTQACVAGLWQGLTFVAMGAALCSLMRRASAALRHTILLGLFAAALVLPWVNFHHSANATISHGVQLSPWTAVGIAFVWVVAVFMRASQLYLAWRHLCKVRREATPIQLLGSVEFRGGRRRAVLCSSTDLDSPSILGFGSPRLLLPDWMLSVLTVNELQQIALHECEHLRRGDDWKNLLLQAGIVLCPLSPALLWLNRRICVQRELAVDAAVIASTAQPLTYAACLTRLAEQRRQRGRLRLALAAWERKSELVQRVHALLYHRTVWTQSQSAWAAGVTAAALLLAATGMARVPQLVHIERGAAKMVADQPLATVVRMTPVAALSRGKVDKQSGPQMLPAVFHVKSGDSTRPHARLKKTRDTNSILGLKAFAEPQRGGAPRMVRTEAVLARHRLHERNGLAQLDVATVRLVNAEFSSSYMAVPTPTGWLLIRL